MAHHRPCLTLAEPDFLHRPETIASLVNCDPERNEWEREAIQRKQKLILTGLLPLPLRYAQVQGRNGAFIEMPLY